MKNSRLSNGMMQITEVVALPSPPATSPSSTTTTMTKNNEKNETATTKKQIRAHKQIYTMRQMGKQVNESENKREELRKTDSNSNHYISLIYTGMYMLCVCILSACLKSRMFVHLILQKY